MLTRPRTAVLATVLALVLAAPLASAAAQSTDPAAEPSANAITPEPPPASAEPSPAPTEPEPSESTPSAPSTPAPTATAVPYPSVTGLPGDSEAERRPRPGAPAPTTLPGTDGQLAGTDYLDEYYELVREHEDLVAELRRTKAEIERDDLAAGALARQVLSAQLDAAAARARLSSASAEVDDVVRELYQTGSSGLPSVADALTAGPAGFLDRLGAAQQSRTIANGVVREAESASLAAQLAAVADRTAAARATAAAVSTRLLEAKASRLRAALARNEQRQSDLGSVAPQVAVGPEGCPAEDVPATLRDGSDALGAARLCRFAVKNAATPQAALAVTWAFRHLGAAYACGGAGRMLPFRADCSSLVSRAYAEGAGLGTAGDGWAPSTRNMVPWDGVALDPHYAFVGPASIRPGDLVLYDTCPQGGCPYKHVVMYLGSPDGTTHWMLHTNACGDIAKVEQFWGFPAAGSHAFLVARRVITLPGEKLRTAVPATSSRAVPAGTAGRGASPTGTIGTTGL